MSSRRATASPNRVGQLWQLPLLIVSLGLFVYAAYLFIDPKGGPSINDKIRVARTFLNQERHQAAMAQLNRLLTTEKLDAPHEAEVRLVALVDQVARRGLAQAYGCKNAVQLLRQVFKLGAGEAAAKVRLAAAVSPRRTLTGQVLPPVPGRSRRVRSPGAWPRWIRRGWRRLPRRTTCSLSTGRSTRGWSTSRIRL